MKFPSAIPGPGRGASWRSPGHPPRPGSQSDRENAALRPPRVAGSTCFTAPEQTRVAIRPRKHGTSASQGGRKHVFYGTRANPGRNRTEKTRHFARPGRLFPGREADSGPKSGIWPERPRKTSPDLMAFFDCQPGPGRNSDLYIYPRADRQRPPDLGILPW